MTNFIPRIAATLTSLSLAVIALVGCAPVEPLSTESTTPIETSSAVVSATPTETASAVVSEEELLEGPTYADLDLDSLLGADKVEGKAGTDGTLLLHIDGLQDEWDRLIAAWPLPVPDADTFPDVVPTIDEPNAEAWYPVGYAVDRANARWGCDAQEAAVQANLDGDDITAQYWAQTVGLWADSYVYEYIYGESTLHVDEWVTPALSGEFKTPIC